MNQVLSFTEENYLKAIYHLSKGDESVSTNSLADQLHTSPASVNDMMKKLAAKNLISYQKYRGATLLTSGKKAALTVVRKHRLWEVFLVEKLGFNWDEVHEVAEQLEHVKSSLLVERLDAFLNHPMIDPHGDPIPDKDGHIKEVVKASLEESSVGTKGILVSVNTDDPSLLQYLDRMSISLGDRVEIKDRVDFDGSIQVEINKDSATFLSKEVAQNLMITVTD